MVNTLLSIAVQLSSINAERLAETMPPKIQFNINLALPSNQPFMRNNQFIIPFTFTLTSMPPVVQITLRGNAIVSSNDKNELKKLDEDIKKKRIPPMIVQTIFTHMIAECIILSRSLGTPPPLPGLPQPPVQGLEKKERSGPQTVI